MAGMWSAPVDKYDILQECRAAFLEGLELVARDGGIPERDAVAALQAGAGDHYDEVAASTHKAGFEISNGLTASRISLVSESELELEIYLNDMTRRLKESQLDGLRRTYLRFVTLFARPNLATSENPVGIEGIVVGLTQMFSKLARGTEKSLAMLELIEVSLNRNLPAMYSRLADILESHNIKPALARIQTPTGEVAGRSGGGNLNSPSSSASQAPSPEEVAANPLAALKNTMLARQANQENIPAQASSVTMEMLQQLFGRLDMLEMQGGSNIPSFQAALPGQATANKNQGSGTPFFPKSNELGMPLSGTETAAIDTLALIFAAISDHPTLPNTIKAAISSLQITILKVAMVDGTFFSDNNHPARVILDLMARAALGLPRDVAEDHPTCASVQDIAYELRAKFQSDIRVFKHYIAELEVLISAREEEVAESAKDYILLIEKWEKLEHAKAFARHTAESLIEDNTPFAIANFIRNDWARVLQLELLEHGENSPQWQDRLNLVRNLLWGIHPMRSVEDRKRLAAAVPAMLTQINNGFDRINLSKPERDAFMDVCFELQTAALRGPQPEKPKPPTVPPVSDGVSDDLASMEFSSPTAETNLPEMEEIHLDGGLLKVWGDTSDNAANPIENPCQIGDWLELSLPGNNQVCGRLCWLNPTNGSSLLCNPDWDFAILISPTQIKQRMRYKKAKVVSSTSLFDAAVAMAVQGQQGTAQPHRY